MPTPDDITRHHDEGEVVYVGSFPTGYTVRVEEPDPTWPEQYAAWEARVLDALGNRVLAIQHIGSTSVPGLPAKPIIDIDLSVADPTDETAYVPVLEGLGLVHWITEPDWHQHRLFKHLGETRVHLHVFGPGCPEMVRHAMFRDWLVAHPEDRTLYAEAKRAAAGELGGGLRYNHVKEPVVRDIYRRMFLAAGLLD